MFHHTQPGVAEENIQARIRGNILMALSNKFHWLVLTTGNKSEVSTGYCTLYGDMAGGLSVLKDVPKGMVYSLAEYINRRSGKDIIPKSIIKCYLIISTCLIEILVWLIINLVTKL